MRFSKILPVLLSLLLTPFLSAKEASDTGLHTFYGEVVLIDPSRKIIELKTGNQRLVFHYNERTRISSTLGQVSLDKVTRGTAAAVVMRVGEGKEGIATTIRFVPNAGRTQTLSMISARTVHGETIRGVALRNFVEYEPPTDEWSGGANFARRNNAGLFVLSVAAGGTVSNVEVRQSTGYPELDSRAQHWMKKWRFHPNSVTEVQLPMYFSQYRHY